MKAAMCGFWVSRSGRLRLRGICCISLSIVFLSILATGFTTQVRAAKLVELTALDQDYLIVHIYDGEVIHHEGSTGEEVIRYDPELNTVAAVATGNWQITSTDDVRYGAGGANPLSCERKKKLNGHAQLHWSGGDYVYDSTYEHWLYLRLPFPLQQGAEYTLNISGSTNVDVTTATLTFDIFQSRSEAVHVNLVGYSPDATHKAADLYHWLGSGGARNYASFVDNEVYAYNVGTGVSSKVGEVKFWQEAGSDVGWYNLTRSDVWSADLSALTTPGTYRLAIEGIGCSQEFTIADDIYKDPFAISLLGYFYMRVGESNPKNISPPPRTPLYIPGVSPSSTTVYLTTMHPYHSQWSSFSDGDKWDNPNDWVSYVKSGSPTNPDGWGGHSDAADWDRHLDHVVNIYDMLLPYLMTDGAIDDDYTGITESGNSVPDIIDEARNEVDFWLRLRDGEGYSHGLTNPNSSNYLYQAAPTPIAAWANAANAAMLADAFNIAGLTSLMGQYRDAAITAFNYADSLANPMLDEGLHLDDSLIRGRDMKMMAAAFLYNVTGNRDYEDVVYSESVCANTTATLQNNTRNQLYGSAAYLKTTQPVNYPGMQNNMRAQLIQEAKSVEADLTTTRPSRRATDQAPAYWRTAHFVNRTIIAHAITTDPMDKDYFLKALHLEADWGLGRNPQNMIQMTTATTALATKRSVIEAYTSGRDDGVAGVHPGQTPYMNLDDWAPGMVMGTPSKLYESSYPADVKNTWPRGETYFPSRWVWAHNEFTPRQTMRGKMALYGYLHGLASSPGPTEPVLTVNIESVAGGGGGVQSAPAGIDCGNDCTESYAAATQVTLTATADSGSVFTGWSGACYGSEKDCELVMNMNRAVTATFEPEGLTYQLSVAKEGSGDGTVTSTPPGISCGSDCSEVYASGATVTLTAVADSNSTFTGWSGACSGTAPCELSISSVRSVTATFQSNTQPALTIYGDALATGWQDWSWGGTINLSGTSPVKEGNNAVNVTLNGWGGFSPAMASGSIDTFGYSGFRFWVHGGTGGNKTISFFSQGTNGESDRVDFVAIAGTWTEIDVSLADLGSPDSLSRINFFNNSANPLATFTLDEIRLIPSSAGIPGDIDNSGSVTLEDAVRVLIFMVNGDEEPSLGGDANEDGRIGVEEAVYILRYLAGVLD